jgi:hypothetical protein
MDFLDGSSSHDFAGALCVFDMHPEQSFDDDMEAAAGELPYFRLFLVENGAFEPTGANHTIRFAAPPYQVVKGSRRSCAVSIDVSNQISQWGKFQSFDERSAFANSFGEIQKAYEWIFGCNFLDDTKGVVLATVEYDDELKFSPVLLLKVTAILAENWLNAALLVIGRDQEQEARLAHLILNSL